MITGEEYLRQIILIQDVISRYNYERENELSAVIVHWVFENVDE